MSEYNYNYHDDNFSLDEAERYNLLIKIDKATFSYAITDQDKLVACADMHPLDELSNPQELLDLLSAKYKHVVVGLPANGFTLVPQSPFKRPPMMRIRIKRRVTIFGVRVFRRELLPLVAD